MAVARMPTVYLPHGGGPCFFMTPPPGPPGTWSAMEGFLRRLPEVVGRPREILMVSAHWEEEVCTVQDTQSPEMVYDYYGFPEYTYELKYPAPGSATLTQRVLALLQAKSIPCKTSSRGFDHGTFVPMLLSFPAADVPIVQLSLRTDLDPAFHVQVGEALAPLRDENVLIVGSGMSYHNLGSFFAGRGNQPSVEFDSWLTETVCGNTGERRNQRLCSWQRAPSARACHPREEHLLPLMVTAGAASGDRALQVHREKLMGKAISAYKFG